MPVAFGPGTGASNSRIDIGSWTIPNNVTYFAWVYRLGMGGGSFGHVFGRGTGALSLCYGSPTETWFGDFSTSNYHKFSVIPIGRWVPISISGDTTVTVTPKVFLDGVAQTLTRVGTGNFWSTTTGSSLSTSIGNRPSDSARNWHGYIAHFARWNVQLTDSEHLMLASGMLPDRIRQDALDNYYPLKNLGDSNLNIPGIPYGTHNYGYDPIDLGQTIKVYFSFTSAGGAITLSVNGLSQSQSLDSINLTQQSTLSVNSCLQEQFLSSINLTQANVLSINNITQSQLLENVVLSQSTLLALQNLVQSQSLQAVSLTQNNILSVNGLNQSQSIPNLVIGAGISLALSDLAQAQALVNITLSQDYNISVNNLLQSHTLSSVTLNTETLQLVVNDLSQNQTLQNILLTQQAVLNVFSLTQTQNLSTAFFSVISTPKNRIYAVTAHNRTIVIK